MKQAVVLIHGIGEQKPMDTLRRFAATVADAPADGGTAYWSKPDRMSELFELRRLGLRGGRDKTHLYEYYWAFNVEGTTVPDVLAWLWGLLRRRPGNVPPAVRPLWWGAWTLLAAAVLLLMLGGLSWLQERWEALSAIGWLGIAVAALGLGLQSLLVHYVGDAARYLSPRPGNIRLRQAIRQQGLRLLRELQTRQPEPYDRIILVGHSLGSVIAYDLVNRLWQECHEELPGLADQAVQTGIRDCLAARASAQPMLRDELPLKAAALAAADAAGRAAALRAFQAAQQAAWRELRGLGNPWRISDLVTAGSPLAHAMLLLADGEADLAARRGQRELPTCPPQSDDKGFAYSRRPPVEVGQGKKFTPLVYHHAAPFAVTRWTNLYFPVARAVLGDVVGGPLAPVFGPGVRDVAVRTAALGGYAGRSPLAHTCYWHPADRGVADAAGALPTALKAMKAALELSQLRHFTPRPPSPPKTPPATTATAPAVTRPPPADRSPAS